MIFLIVLGYVCVGWILLSIITFPCLILFKRWMDKHNHKSELLYDRSEVILQTIIPVGLVIIALILIAIVLDKVFDKLDNIAAKYLE